MQCADTEGPCYAVLSFHEYSSDHDWEKIAPYQGPRIDGATCLVQASLAISGIREAEPGGLERTTTTIPGQEPVTTISRSLAISGVKEPLPQASMTMSGYKEAGPGGYTETTTTIEGQDPVTTKSMTMSGTSLLAETAAPSTPGITLVHTVELEPAPHKTIQISLDELAPSSAVHTSNTPVSFSVWIATQNKRMAFIGIFNITKRSDGTPTFTKNGSEILVSEKADGTQGWMIEIECPIDETDKSDCSSIVYETGATIASKTAIGG